VSNYLAEIHHLPILDADRYAREAVMPGTEILAAIARRYGPTILNPDGTLRRSQLGDIVFQNVVEKQWLEQQIHPYIRDRFAQATAIADHPTVIHVIPLLFEAQLTNQVTEIWVVVCSPEQQIARLMQRNPLTQAQAQVRINSQMPLPEKIAHADVVLDNSKTPNDLFEQVDQALLNPSH